MSSLKKEAPPDITISVSAKFKKKLMTRRVLINYASDIEADATLKCMQDHDEIKVSKNIKDAEDQTEIIDAFDSIRSFISTLLKIELSFARKLKA